MSRFLVTLKFGNDLVGKIKQNSLFPENSFAWLLSRSLKQARIAPGEVFSVSLAGSRHRPYIAEVLNEPLEAVRPCLIKKFKCLSMNVSKINQYIHIEKNL